VYALVLPHILAHSLTFSHFFLTFSHFLSLSPALAFDVHIVLGSRTVVFTGAQRPQKFVDSDASFNIGVAVGAMNLLGEAMQYAIFRCFVVFTASYACCLLGAGCYICMNGRVIEASRCRRDGRTGQFVRI
jgi:L-asparaginase/Glu-tRNA(Gln) amidotransferase subunit D